MAITVTWATRVINVPQADLTNLGGGVYELDLDVFRLALKVLEASEEGMPELDTHRHNTTVTVAGTTLARTLEIINGYTVTFEDGQYAVNLVGANSNVAQVANVNQVSLRSFNTAGLIEVDTGGNSFTVADVWNHTINGTDTARTLLTNAGDRQSAHVSLLADDNDPSTITAIAWLTRNGEPVTSGLVEATLRLLEPDGTVVFGAPAIAMTLDATTGMFRATVTGVTLAATTNYWADVTVEDADGVVRAYKASPVF